jgi:hypothetical protein
MPSKTTTVRAAKVPPNKALSLWSTPAARVLAKRLAERHKMSFSAIVWTLMEALDAGLITIDSGPRVKSVSTAAPAKPQVRGS